MRWISTGSDCFNLDKFIHIWVEKDVSGGYFLMGELDSGEEVALCGSFQCPLQCSNHMHKITNIFPKE